MPYLLRKIDKKRWDKDKVYADYPWLEPNQIPVWCLLDLIDKRNDELSLWHVEGKEDPNLSRICAALAAISEPKIFEYGLFDIVAIEEGGFILHETPGQVLKTPNDPIARLHRDITQLTAPKVLRFLEAVWDKVETGLVFEKVLEGLIKDGVQARGWDRKLVNGKWLNK